MKYAITNMCKHGYNHYFYYYCAFNSLRAAGMKDLTERSDFGVISL